MGKLRKNQPGYKQSKDKNGRTIWVPDGSSAASAQAENLSDSKGDFNNDDQHALRRDIENNLSDTLFDINDQYVEKYSHLSYGDKFRSPYEYPWEEIQDIKKDGREFDQQWYDDAETVSAMLDIVNQDKDLDDQDRKELEKLQRHLHPFQWKRGGIGFSTNDYRLKGNERGPLHQMANLTLKQADATFLSEEELAEKRAETVERTPRLIGTDKAFKELFEGENNLPDDSLLENLYGTETDQYLDAATNFFMELDDEAFESVVDEYYDKADSFLDPYDKAVSVLCNQNFYLSSVFPEKHLASELENMGVENVRVDDFHNGREFGNVYTVDCPNGETASYCVFEYRSGDSIMLNGKKNWDGEELPYSETLGFPSYSYGEFSSTAHDLAKYLKDAQDGKLDDVEF